MKQSVEWHEECLKNMISYMKSEHKTALQYLRNYCKIKKDINFLKKQIEEAKRKKKDGFDRDRFLLKRTNRKI